MLLAAGTSSAQYKIDLSDTSSPSLKYIQMGNTKGKNGQEIKINNLYLEENGIPQVPVMGEFHYSRMDNRYWKDALLKMKSSGINIVSTYCLWSLHEEFEGQMSWEKNLNLRYFVQLCNELGLKVHLRIGPYCNAEIKNGALPTWLVNNKNIKTRTNDPLYLKYVQRWYDEIYQQVGDLLYKNGGPVMAIQLENEYVRKGMVVSHLLNLKKMAVKSGFDVPLYSMTHWMNSEYPKGEIVPYAGYYIETPWTATGKNELPTSDFEYFTYNRISNNIGTDIIKVEGKVESLSGAQNESPYFTCEIGVGTTPFYHRRAIIPEEMAGENINLRLGCGVNLMGYYMYVGGSNPVGKATTFESSGPRISYDYQAPIREFGTLGTVMAETKKYNYFMNDFGPSLAPAIAYLPTSNQNINNLQWAVRTDGKSGYVFCSNYLYKHDRKEYKKVNFSVQLQNETITLPREKVTIKNGAYFLWPFNQHISDILLKYSTSQPICKLHDATGDTYFFFEDDNIPAEYLIDAQNIQEIKAANGSTKREKNSFFINRLNAGKDCVIEIIKKDGTTVRLVTLTEKQSDQLWKGKNKDREFVCITPSSLIYDQNKITIIDEKPTANAWIYKNGKFEEHAFNAEARNLKANIMALAPMSQAKWIHPLNGNILQRYFTIKSFSSVDRIFMRYASKSSTHCQINGQKVDALSMGEYYYADVTADIKSEQNLIQFNLSQPEKGIVAEFEILMKNGERIIWNTDETWTSDTPNEPVVSFESSKPTQYAADEHLAIYEIKTDSPLNNEEETRAYINYKGDIANAYLNGKLVGDSFYDGSSWILSLSRLLKPQESTPLIIRINGLKSANNNIYFEKNVSSSECIQPVINDIKINREYRFQIEL